MTLFWDTKYEDVIWGLFMAKYIFPGADASMPLNWVVGQLELAGFEVANVNNISIHYSLTLKKWYKNWVSNRDRIVAKHGERWYRCVVKIDFCYESLM